MDDGIHALWAAIPESDRGPGVHIMTGPIWVDGAMPGDALRVELGAMTPRLPFGSNCAAHWGLFHDLFGKERITVYELVEGSFGGAARPLFGYDFETRALYDLPGVVTPPDPERREPFGRAVEVPVRPHLGVMGVAPLEAGRRSSVPPGVFGGNVDDWRFGPGATIYYPVLSRRCRFLRRRSALRPGRR